MSLKRALNIDGRLRGDKNGHTTEKKSGLRDIVSKKYCILPLQYDFRRIHKKKLFKGRIHVFSVVMLFCELTPDAFRWFYTISLLSETRILFINDVLKLSALELYKKTWMFLVIYWIVWHIYCVSFRLSVGIYIWLSQSMPMCSHFIPVESLSLIKQIKYYQALPVLFICLQVV